MYAELQRTNHGEKRLQNRAIPEKVIDWLLEFGNCIYQPRNIRIFHFNNRSRKKLIEQLSSSDRRVFDKKNNIYMILDEKDILITAGYRNKRLPRD